MNWKEGIEDVVVHHGLGFSWYLEDNFCLFVCFLWVCPFQKRCYVPEFVNEHNSLIQNIPMPKCLMVFFHRFIFCFRTVIIEEMVKITIPVVVIGTLAIIILIILIYLRKKKGKTFCKKHCPKGNSYLKLHCRIFCYISIIWFFIQTNYLKNV